MRTPQQAVEYATTHLNTGYNGMCLAHVQDAYGAYAVEPSAIAAWNNSNYKHPTSDLASAPFGAPIYWSQVGNPYGHIAIHLTGDRMYTTDSGVGYPHEDSISKWQNLYGYVPLGWTEDVENQLIPDLLGDDDMPSAQEIAAAVWGYQYDQRMPNCYNQLMYHAAPSAEQVAQSVWAFQAKDNPQPNVNPYEQLKSSAQTGGFAVSVDDLNHNQGKTYYWVDPTANTMRGFGSWNEWEVWCKAMHMPTDKVVKLTSDEWTALKTFLARKTTVID